MEWNSVPYSLLDALAPFHAIFGVDTSQVQVSARLTRMAGTETPAFRLVRPFASPIDGPLLNELTGMVLFFELESLPGRQFKGQAIRFDTRLMLVGVPLLRSIADLERFGMVTGDLPLHDATGDLLLAFEANNISLRQAAESQELSRIARRSQEWLLQAKQQADELARLQADFIDNVSHEMKTPLNAIIGFTHLLRQPVTQDEHQRYVEGIGTAGNRLMSIINDVLDFSADGQDARPLQIVTFDLRALCQEISLLWAPKAAARGLDWHVENTVEPVLLMGDPWRVAQLLGYLLSNAVKFTEHGSVSLLVTARQDADDSLLLRFTVIDTGPGMDDAQVGRLFTPFQQADASATRKQGGAGIGLAVCKRIVTRMNGRIDLHSLPGRGTRIWIELPFATVPASEASACIALTLSAADVAASLGTLPSTAATASAATAPAASIPATRPQAMSGASPAHEAEWSVLCDMLSGGDPDAPGYLHARPALLARLPEQARRPFADAVARYDFDAALRYLDGV